MANKDVREESRSLEDAESFLAEGIFRSLVGGVNDMVATTAGITKTQEALLATSRGLLEELRLHNTTRQAADINARSEKIREMCTALSRAGDRLAALRRRAEGLEAELDADGCVAGNTGELRL